MILHLTCMFGCAWKIKFSRKAFQLTVCFMALTRKLVYTFIFITNYFRVSDAQREREREKRDRTPAPRCNEITPSSSHHHQDRTPALVLPSRSSPPKINPPKTDLIGADVTDLVLILNPKLTGAADLVVSISSHQ